MALKSSSSFFKYVTMGALGTQKAIEILSSKFGHEIIELERYSSSNKIWRTKIKRLRLPDLLCTNCGKLFEVRTKTELSIKMSHSPENPDRAWDSGLKDEDIIVLITNIGKDQKIIISDRLNLFTVKSLRESFFTAKLGTPKSASEGSERDVTWPSWVPSADGHIVEIGEKIRVKYIDGRTYSYPSKGKYPYLDAGESFSAYDTVVAGTPKSSCTDKCSGNTWKPRLQNNLSEKPQEAYTTLKWIRACKDRTQIAEVESLVSHSDIRLKLEALGVLASFDHEDAFSQLVTYATISATDEQYAIEVVFILSEIDNEKSVKSLEEIFKLTPFSEVKAAAIWTLTTIFKNSEVALQHLDHNMDEVLAHLIVGLSKLPFDSANTKRLLENLHIDQKKPAVLEIISRSSKICVESTLKYASLQSSETRRLILIALSKHSKEYVTKLSSFELLTVPDQEMIKSLWEYERINPYTAEERARHLNFIVSQNI